MAKQITDTFTITIKGQPDAYTVEADGPKGIHVDPQPLTWFPTLEQEATLAELASEKARVSPDIIRELGRSLHNAVFIPPIATAFGRAQGKIGADRGLRLRLQIEASELVSLPWEVMHDGQDFIATRSNTPLVRTLPSTDGIQPIKRIQVRGALRILSVGASPRDLPTLKIEETGTQLRELLGEAISKKRIVFDMLTNATLDELRSQLVQEDYHILYFAGHGDSDRIYLDDGQGDDDPTSGKRLAGYKYTVSAQTLARELEGKSTRLVFLAACNTAALLNETSGLLAGFAQELARLANLPAVVAMQYRIGDEQANQLTARFFESLAAFYPVDMALAEARKSLIRLGQVGRDVVSPVMYLQAKDGALFQRARNWIAIGFATAATIAILAFAIQLLLFQPDRQQIAIAQSTAQAEATQRAIAETQQVIAESTAQAEATARVFAQSTAQAEATQRAIAETQQVIAESTAQAEAIARAAADRAAQARRLAAQSEVLREQDLALLSPSVLLAVESLRRYPTLEGDQALRHGLPLLPRLIAQMDHEGCWVYAVTFSPDGQWVASGCSDGIAHVWAANTGQEVARMVHEGWVQDVAFSPDGQWVVSGSDDGTARVWEAATGREVARMVHESGVNAVAFSPDGQWIASGYGNVSSGSGVMVWEATTGQEVARMVHEGWVQDVAFSPDGRWMASGSWDSTARVWEAATGREVARMEHESSVRAVAFSPDGQWVATASLDGTARVWQVATGQEIARKTGDRYMSAVAFSPDGQWVVSGNADHTVQVWEAATGQEVARMVHERSVLAVDFSPDGKWVVASEEIPEGRIGTSLVRVWEVATGRELARMTHMFSVVAVAFSPDGKWVVSGDREGTMRVWQVIGGEVARVSHEGEGGVGSVAFSPNGQWVASGGHNTQALVWEAATGQEVARLEHEGRLEYGGGAGVAAFSPDGQWVATESGKMVWVWEVATGREVARMEHEDWVSAVAFSPDGQWVVVGSGKVDSPGEARVWEVATGREVARMEHEGPVEDVAFSPDGQWVATAGVHPDYTARVWEAATGQEVARMTHPSWGVTSVAFSPDGQWVASGGHASGVLVWEAATGQQVAQVDHPSNVYAVAFSPDGKLGASGDYAHTVIVWDAVTGWEVSRMSHEGEVFDVAFSPDGQWVVSRAGDGTARVWEAVTGQEVARMNCESAVLDVAFSPDGRWLVSGCADGTARVSWLQPTDLIVEACSRLTLHQNELTQEEWRQYVGDEPYHATCSCRVSSEGCIWQTGPP